MDLTPLFAGEKTEAPTERRLKSAGDEGRQADLAPLSRPLTFLAALAALRATLPASFERLSGGTEVWLAGAGDGRLPDLASLVSVTVASVAPPALAAAAAAFLVQAVLGTRFWAPSRIAVDPAKPFGFPGVTAWAPINILANGAASLTKLTVLAALAWFAVPRPAAGFDVSGVPAVSGRLACALGAAWLALGIVEYGVGLIAHRASLWMTRHEAREDRRQAEGDPRVAQWQREAIERRLTRPPAPPAA